MSKITKQDLLKLKDSKPVPITAHSHEVIIPVVYASRVNKFLEKEGIHLPLTHHQLAELKRKASKVKGKIQSKEGSDEGNSHAKGTHNIKVSNVKGNVFINTEKKKKKRKAKKTKVGIKTFSGLLQAEDKGTGIRIRPPPSNTLRPNYNTFATIRPQGITYSANTPTLADLQAEYKAEAKKEKDAIEKREKQLLLEGEQQRKNIDNLQLALEHEKQKQQALIGSDIKLLSSSSSSLSKPPPLQEELESHVSEKHKVSDEHENELEDLIEPLRRVALNDFKKIVKGGRSIEQIKVDLLKVMRDFIRSVQYADLTEAERDKKPLPQLHPEDIAEVKKIDNPVKLRDFYKDWVNDAFMKYAGS